VDLVKLKCSRQKGKIMNKSELIASIAELSNLKKSDSEKALDAFVKTVEDALKLGEEVRLVSFGTFSTVKRKATIGRNPKTGEEIKIPSRISPKFKPGKQLKDAVGKNN
jgi:DNA-binding protein HU-beta